jgi:hypothetical protein
VETVIISNIIRNICKENLDDYRLPENDNHHSHRRGNLKSYKENLVACKTVESVTWIISDVQQDAATEYYNIP